jgi:CDP-diacylglycerol--glycerol-3-phosphate 3-phosphatidyltransferase
MTGIAKLRQATADYITLPLVRLLARTRVKPNTITWLGFVITIGAATLVGTGHLFAAGFVALFAGLFDMLDGALARHTGRVTRFGTVLDATLDRLSEAALFLGILVVLVRGQQVGESLLVGITLVSSLMVSYIRARVEALGLDGREGLFTRPERVIVIALGLLLSQFSYALVTALAVVATLSLFTVGQRLFYAWRQTRT